MTLDDFCAAAKALYGPTWQKSLSRLSHDLNVPEASVRRWISGADPVDSSIQSDLITLLAIRQCERIVSVMASTPGVPAELTLACYESDNDLHEVTGDDWSAAFHALMLQRITELLREHGIAVRAASINAEDYFRWLGRRNNTPATRAEFAGLSISTAH